MTKVVLDTNLYVGWLNRGLHERLLLGTGLVRYLSSVVLMELRAVARTRAAGRGLDRIARAYAASGRIIVPPVGVFDDAGSTLRKLQDRGRDVRRASLAHDVLIALTARAIGATVYTADASDFETIRAVAPFSLEIVEAAR